MRVQASSVKGILVPVLAAIITICSLNGSATAGTLSLSEFTFSEYMVAADPGEDPHLKTDPEINIFTLPIIEVQQAPLVGSGDSRDMLAEQGRASKTATGWYSRVNHKFRMVFNTIILTINR